MPHCICSQTRFCSHFFLFLWHIILSLIAITHFSFSFYFIFLFFYAQPTANNYVIMKICWCLSESCIEFTHCAPVYPNVCSVVVSHIQFPVICSTIRRNESYTCGILVSAILSPRKAFEESLIFFIRWNYPETTTTISLMTFFVFVYIYLF